MDIESEGARKINNRTFSEKRSSSTRDPPFAVRKYQIMLKKSA
jgi:hypothetical protein